MVPYRQLSVAATARGRQTVKRTQRPASNSQSLPDAQSKSGTAPAAAPGRTTRIQRSHTSSASLSAASTPGLARTGEDSDPDTNAQQDHARTIAAWTPTAIRPDMHDAPVMRAASQYDSGADPGSAFANATAGAASEVPYRGDMERAFQQDFSDVRAHLGQEGPMAALSAHAATDGSAVAFASATPDREVVAHELTHVVQARNSAHDGAVAGKSAVSSPADPAEREADAIAPRAAAGHRVMVSGGFGVGIHRDLLVDVRGAVAQAQGDVQAGWLNAWGVIIQNQGERIQATQLDLQEAINLLQNKPPVFPDDAVLPEIVTYLSNLLLRIEIPTRQDDERTLVALLLADTDDLQIATDCMSRLYGAAFQNGNANWDLTGLRQVHEVLAGLPTAHVIGNPSARQFIRQQGGNGKGGHDQDTVTLAYNSATMADDVYAAVPAKQGGFANTGDPAVGKNKFDRAVRHEMGHAVYDQSAAAQKYVSNCAAKWQSHILTEVIWLAFREKPIEGLQGELLERVVNLLSTQVGRGQLDPDDMKTTLGMLARGEKEMRLIREEMKKEEEAKKEEKGKEKEKQKAEKIEMTGEHEKEENQILHAGQTWLDVCEEKLDQKILDHHVIRVLVHGTSSPWFEPFDNPPTIGGRVFLDTQNGDWASYLPDARARKVSNYQFKSPSEFFAEAYATYFDPVQGQTQLMDRDPETGLFIMQHFDQ